MRRSLRTYAPLIRFHRLPLPSRYFEPREDRKITFRLQTGDLAIRWFFFPLVFFQRFRISVRDITIFPLSPLPSSFYSRRWPSGKLDDTASFKDRMFEGICFIRAHRIVVCFAEIVVFVVSLENSLQFHPCIFFPLVGFVFEEDFSGFGFRVCFFLFLFFLFVRCCVELWITIAGELNTELKRISGIVNGVRYDGARVSSNI